MKPLARRSSALATLFGAALVFSAASLPAQIGEPGAVAPAAPLPSAPTPVLPAQPAGNSGKALFNLLPLGAGLTHLFQVFTDHSLEYADPIYGPVEKVPLGHYRVAAIDWSLFGKIGGVGPHFMNDKFFADQKSLRQTFITDGPRSPNAVVELLLAKYTLDHNRGYAATIGVNF